MAIFLYRLFIRLYPFFIFILSPFNQKAALWTAGRKNIFEKLKQAIPQGEKIIWMHCSSLGEFEQGRPVIEKLKIQYPHYRLLITFFSPSGYEASKNYNGADYIYYLPMDSKKNAAVFFEIVRPALVIYIKYEFWHFYLQQAKKHNTPLLLVSAIFRKGQPFFSWYGAFHRSMLSCFTYIFVQNNLSVKLLHSIGITANVLVAGDTRFDRVVEIASKPRHFETIEAFCGSSAVVVAGSTWLEDDKELDHFANTRTDIKFIIAPHNIGRDRLTECLHYYKHAVLFSSLTQNVIPAGKNILIIDNVGMLSSLYRYATVCYVGGGFGGDGVHNVLEAAVYGKPVVFGPEYDKYAEAVELIDQDGALTVSNALQLEKELDLLLKKEPHYYIKSKAAREYVYSKKGSTDKVLSFIQEKRLLTT